MNNERDSRYGPISAEMIAVLAIAKRVAHELPSLLVKRFQLQCYCVPYTCMYALYAIYAVHIHVHVHVHVCTHCTRYTYDTHVCDVCIAASLCNRPMPSNVQRILHFSAILVVVFFFYMFFICSFSSAIYYVVYIVLMSTEYNTLKLEIFEKYMYYSIFSALTLWLYPHFGSTVFHGSLV